jgi:hypothetical protein
MIGPIEPRSTHRSSDVVKVLEEGRPASWIAKGNPVQSKRLRDDSSFVQLYEGCICENGSMSASGRFYEFVSRDLDQSPHQGGVALDFS